MSDRLEKLPIALSGAINVGEPNTSIKLYEGRLKVSKDNMPFFEEIGSVELSWFPSPGLRFSIHNPEGLAVTFSVFDGKFSVELLEANMLLEAFGTSFNSYTLAGVIAGEAESSSSDEIQYITFYVPNFIDFRPIAKVGQVC